MIQSISGGIGAFSQLYSSASKTFANAAEFENVLEQTSSTSTEEVSTKQEEKTSEELSAQLNKMTSGMSVCSKCGAIFMGQGVSVCSNCSSDMESAEKSEPKTAESTQNTNSAAAPNAVNALDTVILDSILDNS